MDNYSTMKKPPKRKSRKDKRVSFRALPEEVESWNEMAAAEGRSLSNFIRLKVNKSLEEPTAGATNPKKENRSDPPRSDTKKTTPGKRE